VNTLEDAFTTLLGKQPSDAEKQALFRARDAFHLKNNDALWLLLAFLGHYETLYCKIPTLIAESATRVTEKARTAAEAEFRAAGARVRSELAQSVAKAAREIADRAANTRRSQWIAACLAIAASGFVVVGGWAFGTGRRSGFDAGRAEGYSAARDEKAAAAWANTPEGQLAYSLAKAGSIRELALCSGRGWRREGGYGVPRADKSGIFGWRLANKDDDGR
jgi:hypothetical protein